MKTNTSQSGRIHRDSASIAARSHQLEARNRFADRRSGLPQPRSTVAQITWLEGRKRWAQILYAPSKLSFIEQYDPMLGFIYALHQQQYLALCGPGEVKLHSTTLRDVKSVSLDGALALTAEYHRCILQRPNVRPCINDDDWPPEIRRVFMDMGFYELVRASSHTAAGQPPASGVKFVPFISAESVEGERLDELINNMAAVAGQTPKRLSIYGAIIEAMNNAVQHAYTDMPPQIAPVLKRWWAAGAYFPKDDVLQFAFYDQGVGIPHTLPAQGFFEAILKLSAQERTDADVIAGAIELGRTSTAGDGRGNGLWMICKLAEELDGSHVHILSGRGQVTYSSQGRVVKKRHDNEFSGTLILWALKLPS